MRNRLLIAIVGLATVTTLVACGDASDSTGIQRGRGAYVPGPNDDPSDDPNAPKDPDSAPNPNATTPPAAPATPGTTAGQLGVALSNTTPATDLGTTIDITVTVEPKAGFTGQATLTATGLPEGATAAFNPASVTLNTTPVTSKLTVTVPYTAVPSAAGAASAVVVKAAAGAIEATANANFKVNPKVTMTIPVNSAALIAAGGNKRIDAWAGPAFGTAPQPLKTQAGNNIVFVVKNNDSAPRTVHGNGGAAGFAHGDGAVAPGATDPKVRAYGPGTNANGYLHGETNNAGVAVGFGFTIVAAP